MKIYRVEISYETVIRAASQKDAERQANRILRDSDEEPATVTAVEVTRLPCLPKGWNEDCRPWGDPDPHDKTLREILGHNAEFVSTSGE